MKIDIKFDGEMEVIADLSSFPEKMINAIDNNMGGIIERTFDLEVKNRLSRMGGKPFDRTGDLIRSFDITRIAKGFWRYGQIPGTAMAHVGNISYGVLQEYGFWHVLAKRWIQYPFFIPGVNASLEPFGYEIKKVVDEEITKINKKK